MAKPTQSVQSVPVSGKSEQSTANWPVDAKGKPVRGNGEPIESYMARLEQFAEAASTDKTESATKRINMKVAEDGSLRVYGCGTSRYPFSAHRDGWEDLLTLVQSGELQKFIGENKANLPTLAQHLAAKRK